MDSEENSREKKSRESKIPLLKELPPGRALRVKSCHFAKTDGRRNTLPSYISKTTWAIPGEMNSNKQIIQSSSCFF